MHILKTISFCNRRTFSSVTNEQARHLRNQLFTQEKLRQQSLIPRVEKIEVRYLGVPQECNLIMNKNLSTPYHCAMHIHEMLCQRSVVAEVNGNVWDMHRPLETDCDLRFLNFHTAPERINKIFWRSCSFLLGLIVEKAFKDEHFIKLHSWPKPNIHSGSYVYDADISIPNWEPTNDELKVFTTMLCKLSSEDNPFERLNVTETVAIEMFEHNPFKQQQIESIASGDATLTVYRVRDHIDISCGPMIANTKFVGTSQVASVHHLDRDCGYRFQAVSIPKQLTLSSFAFSVLVDRAKYLNSTGLKDEVKDAVETSESSVAESSA